MEMLIRGIVDKEVLKLFEVAIEDPNTTEKQMQEMFQQYPKLLAPLGYECFRREVHLQQSDLLLPTKPLLKKAFRIPDIVGRKDDAPGIQHFYLSSPMITEMKQPMHKIIDNSTLNLSLKSREVIGQLISAARHAFRAESVEKLSKAFGWHIDEIFSEELRKSIAKYEENIKHVTEDDFRPIMHKMQDEGMVFLALIGLWSEFKDDFDTLEKARKEFAVWGITLITYDELALLNELLVDYATTNKSLRTLFSHDYRVSFSNGSMLDLNNHFALTSERLKELQALVHRSNDSICLYGIGLPPKATKTKTANGSESYAMWTVHAHFDISSLQNDPEHLKGKERLLWAGRHSGDWLVVKERLTEPLEGAVVWYKFAPPKDIDPYV